MNPSLFQKLRDRAREAAGNAYCPYSRFAVGAAVITEDGQIHPGCNVENAALGLTCCAERNALVSALARGARPGDAVALVIYTPGDRAYTPCGSCRQFMAELMPGDGQVVSTCDGEQILEHSVASLLPHAFDFDPPRG